MKNTVIFDLDGTLLYTLEDIMDSVNDALSKFNLPTITIEQTLAYVGKGSKVLMELATKLPAGEKFDEVFKYFIKVYESNTNQKTHLYDGLDELLIKLKKDGFKLGILSNKPNDATQAVYKQLLSKYNFDFVVGNILGVFKPKPDKSCVDYCLQNLNSKPEECIYVGDSDIDMLTAKGSNLDEVGVLWGYRTKDDLLSAGCTRFANNAKELEEYIYSLK